LIRQSLAARGAPAGEEFRWRGAEVTRIEGLADAVFGFAITLLVVSLEVPASFAALVRAMNGLLAFAISFSLLISVWRAHYHFFRRYGLHDRITDYLNAVLLFVVLFYVYPLKFLFTVLAGVLTGHPPSDAVILRSDMPALMVIFSIGFAAVNMLFVILHLHAFRQRAALELSPVEEVITREEITDHAAQVGVALLSIVCARVIRSAGLAGLCYMLLAPLLTIVGMYYGRLRRKAASATPAVKELQEA
jgi:uncharacterized membrane protein